MEGRLNQPGRKEEGGGKEEGAERKGEEGEKRKKSVCGQILWSIYNMMEIPTCTVNTEIT